MESTQNKTRCPHSKKCGGCQLQNLDYKEQLAHKERTCIRLLGKFCRVEPIIGMENPYHYRNKVQAASLEGQDFCWICNPNNPDGKLIHRTELLRLISANPQTTFIIDQAYVAFTTEDMLKPSDVKTHKNLILVQSISKAYNIPGLRIGYLVSSPEIAEKVNKYIIPWSVNAIAIEASKYILIHPAQFTLPIRKWQRETADFIYQLSKLDGLEVIPTSTTFFLVRLKKGTAADLKQFLLDNYGILIRDASNFRGLDETYLRLSTQKADENQLLLEGVKIWLDQR